MEKVFWLKILCRLFYAGSFLLVTFFFYLATTGNGPGTDRRGGLSLGALLIGFPGLLGDVVGDIADDMRRRG